MLQLEAVQPALYNAFLLSTKDALCVFEAAQRGLTPLVTRRLQDSEKAMLITSGSVFVFDEVATGIKRWTDGAIWSPSRIIGNYLVYRELEKKGAIDNSNTYGLTSGIDGLDGDADLSTDSAGVSPDRAMTNKAPNTGSTGLQRDLERALVGSLTSTYRFKKGGLVKKTISNGHLHIICYYTLEDIKAGRLRTPSNLVELASLDIAPHLLNHRNFRLPPQTELDAQGVPRYVGEGVDAAAAQATLTSLVRDQAPLENDRYERRSSSQSEEDAIPPMDAYDANTSMRQQSYSAVLLGSDRHDSLHESATLNLTFPSSASSMHSRTPTHPQDTYASTEYSALQQARPTHSSIYSPNAQFDEYDRKPMTYGQYAFDAAQHGSVLQPLPIRRASDWQALRQPSHPHVHGRLTKASIPAAHLPMAAVTGIHDSGMYVQQHSDEAPRPATSDVALGHRHHSWDYASQPQPSYTSQVVNGHEIPVLTPSSAPTLHYSGFGPKHHIQGNGSVVHTGQAAQEYMPAFQPAYNMHQPIALHHPNFHTQPFAMQQAFQK